MTTSPQSLMCPRCGRSVFSIIRCADRKQGMCPYVRRWYGPSVSTFAGLLFLQVFVGIWLASLIQKAWVIAAVVGVGIFVWLLTWQVHLYNSSAGVMIQSTTLAGLEVKRRVMRRGNALDIRLKPVRPLRYPLSIATLGDGPRVRAQDDDRAPCVVRAALVGLLLQDLVEIRPIAYYGRGAGQSAHVTKTEHVIVARSGTLSGSRVRALETRILRTLTNGAGDQAGKAVWYQGLRVQDLVSAYFEKDVPDPQGSVLDEVERDAAGFDLCRLEWTGLWGKTQQAVWGGQCIDDLRADAETADDLAQQFKSVDPVTWDSLFKQISDGLKSRIETGD